MPFFVILMIVALVFYSTAIWSERFARGLKLWMVVIFTIGFFCDFIGTWIMRSISAGTTLNIHSIAGFSALIIMLLHLIWAIVAILWRGKAQELFSRYSIYAWSVWLLAFLTGVPQG